MPASEATTPLTALAMVGLGRMGANMSRRLARAGFSVHGFDPEAASREALVGEARVVLHASLQEAIQALPSPRVVWLMVPAGKATDAALQQARALLNSNDIVIDGGNANYLDSQARAQAMGDKGPQFVDCGVSGGVHGLANGYCLMVGGEKSVIARLKPILQALAPAPDRGWVHCGGAGAGHFAKMLHNGIEYGMMQALAEGFALMMRRPELIDDPASVAEAWRHGSVVRSWLLDITAGALADGEALGKVAPFVADSGEGRWTIDEAIRQGTPVPVIAAAMMTRFDSQGHADPANRLLAMMRKGFGGHAVK
jgi:6-phosphogluconate dehydrogenase